MNGVKWKEAKLSFIYAVIVHIAVFILLCVSLRFNPEVTPQEAQSTEVIQAVAIDQTEVRKEIAKIKKQETVKRNAAMAKQKRLEHLAKQAETRRKRAEKDIQRLKLHRKELEKKQLIQQEAEAKKLAQIKKQQALEKKRLMELKKHAAQAVERKKIIKQSTKIRLEEQLAKEQKQLDSLHNQNMQSEVEKYKALILNAIGQHWIVPPHTDKNLSTQLLIRLAPDGVVLNVKILKGSGDAVLDRSAINAVWKASPLPVPKNTTLFERFRELRLTVKPTHVL